VSQCIECGHPIDDHDPDFDVWVCTFEGQFCSCKGANVLRELALIAAKWVGTCSADWKRLEELAQSVPGLTQELADKKRTKDAWTALHAGDPW